MQQFYITKMVMLIFIIVIMHLYLFSVCLVCLVLKNIYFKEHPWVIVFTYSSPPILPGFYGPEITFCGNYFYNWVALHVLDWTHGNNLKTQIVQISVAQLAIISDQDKTTMKWDQVSWWGETCSFLQIWSHLLKKPLMRNFFFCAGLHSIHRCIYYISKVCFGNLYL